MWVEGFSNKEFIGLLVGLVLSALGYWSYRVEVKSARDAAENVAIALMPAEASLELTASAVEEFYDLLKDLSIPKIFAISGIAVLLWSLGLLDLAVAIGG